MWTGYLAPGDDDPDGRRARPPIQDRHILGEQGETLHIIHRADIGVADTNAQLLCEIEYREFAQCPICLVESPSTKEHVPPQSMGGSRKTLLCGACNNRLGSLIEPDLLDWRDDAIRLARASAAHIAPGLRSLPRLLRRQTESGEFVLLPEGHVDQTFRDMLASGEFTLHLSPPDLNRVKLAAMKHAYLAACIHLGEIPQSASANQIRHELVSARDASRRDVPFGEFAAQIPLARGQSNPINPSLALVGAPHPTGDLEVWVSLAGSIFTAWPLPDVPPFE